MSEASVDTNEDTSGRDVQVEDGVKNERRQLILRTDNIHPGILEVGGTEIVLQRHGKYIRDKDDPNVGNLTEDAREQEREIAENYFKRLFEQVSNEELQNTHVLVIASDTSYAGGGQRSYETASIAQEVVEEEMKKRGLSTNNIVNISQQLKGKGGPRPMDKLREPQIFDKSPEFVEFLKEKYGGMGKDFWIAFEKDTERVTREEMGAEGPDEIADRTMHAMKVMARYAKLFHEKNPDSRLVVWVCTHYDTISPTVKRDILREDKDAIVLVDHCGGIVVDIGSSGKAVSNIEGKNYDVNL